MRPEDRELAREIGQRMRKTRRAVFGADLPQAEFARLMRFARQPDISRWETGGRIPSVADLVRYARVCGVQPEEILAGIAPTRSEQIRLLSLDGIAPPTAKVVQRLVDMLREPKRGRPDASRRAS
jgi:transcriptional regulator with XRE-family HTH domain